MAKGQEVQSSQSRQLVELGRQRDSIEAERVSTLSRVSELVARIGELETAVEQAAQSVGDEELVKELEKKLESMSNDMEDTEDKYLKVRRASLCHEIFVLTAIAGIEKSKAKYQFDRGLQEQESHAQEIARRCHSRRRECRIPSRRRYPFYSRPVSNRRNRNRGNSRAIFRKET